MLGVMPMVNAISKKTDNLWVVGLVAGTICGLSKGLYDRKTYNSISGFSRGKTWKSSSYSHQEALDAYGDLPDDEKIAEELAETVTQDDFTEE